MLTPAAAQREPIRSAAVAEFDGRVGSVDRAARSFTVRDLERGTVRVRVTRSTRFERVAGFRGVRRGLLVEVTARGARGRWTAVEVERPGRRRGGDDDSRSDDDAGRGRGSDD